MSLSQSQKSIAWLAVVTLVFVGAVVALTLILRSGPGVRGMIEMRPRVTLREDATGGDLAAHLPIEQFLPSEVLNLDARDAMARNLALPVSTGPNPVAPAFVAEWLGPDLADATKCLANAIYYEATGEPMAGQRAVAQVVLNRLRNPRYPKTICDVVYQGAERPTGCQFSFACDGSTRRAPVAAGWAVANAVASSVLSGVISTEAGQATHYHTLAVFPAWAPQLAKIGIIGHHVFYRPPGRATFGYEGIIKARTQNVRSAAIPIMPVLDPTPVLAAVPASPSTVDASAEASPALVGGNDIGGSRSSESATVDRRDDPRGAVAELPRSMFPIRRARTPNLPLASDH